MTDPAEMDDEAIAKLCEEATPGPWKQHDAFPACEYLVVAGPLDDEIEPVQVAECDWNYTTEAGAQSPNARFIAASRTLVPALLARSKAAEQERDDRHEDSSLAYVFRYAVKRGIIDDAACTWLLDALNVKGG